MTPKLTRRTRALSLAAIILAVGSAAGFYFWSEKGRDTLYNEETVAIMRRVMRPDSNGIDVGAFEGELTRPMVRIAPRGTHYAIEPQPAYAARLRKKFPQVKVREVALGEAEGTTTFTLALDDPAYSGFKPQAYPRADEQTRTIQVRVARLDDLVPVTMPIGFIKIDVEGAEFLVLRGAKELIRRDRPVIVFEYGQTGMQDFGTMPAMMWALLHDELGLELSLMRTWLDDGPALTADAFSRIAWAGTDWMFIAYPPSRKP